MKKQNNQTAGFTLTEMMVGMTVMVLTLSAVVMLIADFQSLLNAERRATEYALVESPRPNFTLIFPKVDAHHVGEFIMLWQIVTAAGFLSGGHLFQSLRQIHIRIFAVGAAAAMKSGYHFNHARIRDLEDLIDR